jgi:gamma-glutamylcyclotransferase (GGCT)/AIG2-like uncharacterized protein YtfP
MAMQHLFVYGSLGPGRPNEHVLAVIGGTWQAATLKGRLVQAGWGAQMGFPGLVIDEQGADIVGHVFSAENLEQHWARLDEFEGLEYTRVEASVTLEDGTRLNAQVYALR